MLGNGGWVQGDFDRQLIKGELALRSKAIDDLQPSRMRKGKVKIGRLSQHRLEFEIFFECHEERVLQ